MQKNSKNHQVILLQLQKNILDIGSLYLVELVNQLERQIKINLNDDLDVIISSLKEISREEELLRFIASGENGQDPSQPVWLQFLYEIGELS